MKKIDLLHTTVLIVAILCGYSALQELLSILNVSFYYSDVFVSAGRTTIMPALFQTALYTIACIILVRNSKRIATYLLGNERPEFDEFLEDETAASAGAPASPAPQTQTSEAEYPDNLEWHLNRRNILFALFIGLGMYTLIQYIPALLNDLVSLFKGEVGSGALDLVRPRQRDHPILDLLHLTIGALLIYAAPTLTNYIEKTIAIRLLNDPKSS
jgi:hypothetical protein